MKTKNKSNQYYRPNPSNRSNALGGRKRTAKLGWPDVLLIAATIFFVCCMLFAVREWQSEHEVYHRSEQSLHYDIIGHEYARLGDTYAEEYAGGSEMPAGTEPLLSVGRYYYAALMYEACIDRLPDRAVYWQAEMDQAKQRMGEYTQETEEIERLLQ